MPTLDHAARLVFSFDTKDQAWDFAQGNPARGLDSVTWEK